MIKMNNFDRLKGGLELTPNETATVGRLDSIRENEIFTSPKTKSTKMRFIICALGVISIAMSQMSRSVINFCITSMVHPKMHQSNRTISSGGSCPRPKYDIVEEETRFNLTMRAISVNNSLQLDDLLNFEVLHNKQETPPSGGGILSEMNDLYEDKFMWTIQEQSYVLGGFFYSYFIFLVVGGRLSEAYGAKYVLLLDVAGSAIINMATPWMARTSLTLLAASRVLMGVLQSGAHPATYALINRWLPMSEASIFAPMIKMSVGIGQLSASLIPGLILKWPNVFYVISALGIGWSIIWLIVATSDPSTNRWVSKTELAHIMKEKKNFKLDESSDKIAKKKTPWLKIITSPSVIGLIIAKLTYNFCSDWLNVELPSYLKYVHHAPIQKISAITTAMFVVQVSSVLPAGWLAKVCVQKKPWGLSKTSTRKIFESISTVGSTILLILIIFNGCNLTYVTVYLMLIGLVSTFEAGGDTMLPYDLSEEYPATILSIALCIGNLSGIAVTTLTSFVLGDQGGSQARWHTLIALIAAFVFAGGLVFCLMIKAKPIDFESKKKQSANENIESASTDRSQVDSIDSV